MEMEENVNPGTEKLRFSKIAFQNRAVIYSPVRICLLRHSLGFQAITRPLKY